MSDLEELVRLLLSLGLIVTDVSPSTETVTVRMPPTR